MEQASIQGLVSHAETHHQRPVIRSGHAPELPLDLIGFESNFFAASLPANDSRLDDIVSTEDEQLSAAINRGYAMGVKTGAENLRSWCTASMIGGAVAMLLFAGAFPDAAMMVLRHQPAPLLPAAQASLNATSR